MNNRIFKTASFRLSVFYGGIFAIGFGFVLVVTYWSATHALKEQIRAEVNNDFQDLVRSSANEGIASIAEEIAERAQMPPGSRTYYFLADSNGSKIAGNFLATKQVDGWQEISLPDEKAVELSLSTDEDHILWGQGEHLRNGGYLFVGQDAHRVLTEQEAIVDAFIWSALGSLIFVIIAGLRVSQLFLRQIDAISSTSEAIMEGNLKNRIPVKGTLDEFDRLSLNLNRMLDYNQTLLDALKNVTANIAHDLRTPLSRLRQELEEARHNSAGAPISAINHINSAIRESEQLLETFAALLRISQIESGAKKSGFRDLDLSEIFMTIAEAYKPVAEDAGKQFKFDIAPHIHFLGDRNLLIQMLSNLVENSINHTQENTKIELQLSITEGVLTGCLKDTGPGIDPSEYEAVFRQFYRVKGNQKVSGTGLGLSLVSAIANLHGIKIVLSNNNPGLAVGLIFSIIR